MEHRNLNIKHGDLTMKSRDRKNGDVTSKLGVNTVI